MISLNGPNEVFTLGGRSGSILRIGIDVGYRPFVELALGKHRSFMRRNVFDEAIPLIFHAHQFPGRETRRAGRSSALFGSFAPTHSSSNPSANDTAAAASFILRDVNRVIRSPILLLGTV